MKKEVKAATVVEPEKIEIRQYPYPDLPKAGAIVKNLVVGICGTDKHTYHGATKHRAGLDNEYNVGFPLVQGHEWVATIEEAEKGFTDYYGEELKYGDRVVVCPVTVCGKCFYCKTMPWYPWCNSKTEFAIYGHTQDTETHHGAMSEYMALKPNTYLFKVPDGLPNDLAVFTEPMTVTYTLDKAKEFYSFDGEGFAFGSSVVIQGAGPIGIAHIVKARMLGADKIFVSDISDYKLQIAKAFGADVILNVKDTTPEERIQIVKDQTYGLGTDLVVDCAGVPSVVPEGIEMLRIAGMYLEPGQYVETGGPGLSASRICAKSIRFIGVSDHSVPGYRPTMHMLNRTQKDYPWEKLISHRFNLDDYETAIQVSMTDESMKVLVYPWGIK